jgi:hypothetical protein
MSRGDTIADARACVIVATPCRRAGRVPSGWVVVTDGGIGFADERLARH